LRDPRRASDRNRHQEQQHQIRGQDAAGTPGIEGAKQVGRIAVVEEDPGDEESREHEEEVHATPGEVRQRAQSRGPFAQQWLDRDYEPVQEEDQEDGDAADSVELR
jgi:hypothetical protein